MSLETKLVSKSLDLDDFAVHYWEGGHSLSQIPVLFLHGWGISTEAYVPALSLISNKYWVIAPDLPGFGGSNHSTADWSYDQYADSIRSFLDLLAVRKINVVGQSMGGGISIVLAAKTPSLVHSISLVDSAGIPLGTFQPLLMQRLVELPMQALKTGFGHHKPMSMSFFHNLLFRNRNIRGSLRLPLCIDLRPLVTQIAAPCQILWGENDRTIPLSHGVEFSKLIKGSRLKVIKDAYHEWSALMPETFASEIIQFVDEVGNGDVGH